MWRRLEVVKVYHGVSHFVGDSYCCFSEQNMLNDGMISPHWLVFRGHLQETHGFEWFNICGNNMYETGKCEY